MMKFSRALALVLIASFLFLTSVAAAGAAQSYLEAKQKELTALIKQPKTPANDKKLTVTFDALLDYDAFAKDSLGTQWDKLSESERKEFQSLLTTLVQRSYTKNIRDTLEYNIIFKGESKAKKGELVETVAKHKSDPRKETIKIDYLVHNVSGGWRVYDIITEGESLVGNYKSQFRRVIRKEGMAGLLGRMRDKAAEG
jgi:phospholipid transport system substrate-binding protein